jgi:hypothetical protein
MSNEVSESKKAGTGEMHFGKVVGKAQYGAGNLAKSSVRLSTVLVQYPSPPPSLLHLSLLQRTSRPIASHCRTPSHLLVVWFALLDLFVALQPK